MEGIMMRISKAAALFLAGFAVFALATASTTVSAKDKKDNPNYGVCKSGKTVGDIHNCKENGGTK
jgi:hypothetical protein